MSSMKLNNFKQFLLNGLKSRHFSTKENHKTYQTTVIKKDAKELTLEPKCREKLKDNQVRIQVHYCSIDTLCFQGSSTSSPHFTPLSGEVIEIGKDVKPEQIINGEKVAGVSFKNLGGFAEECVLDINDVFRLPSNVELKSAAVLTGGHAIALWAFSKLHQLKKDETVLVTAGRAGLGLAAVDVAHNVYGAKVIGVVDSSERAELIRKRGAFQTIQFDSKLLKNVMSATKNKGVDVIYDAVGKEMFESIGKCVNHGGKVFHAAPSIENVIPAPRLNSYLMMLSLLELRKHDPEGYRSVINDTLDLADQGVLEAYISAKFNFVDINKAISYIEENKATGKIIIEMI